MFDDELREAIAAAQRAPAEDYILWAEVGNERGEIALHSVRLPLGFSTEVSISRLQAEARKWLAAAGFTGAEADSARLHLEKLVAKEEIETILGRIVAAGDEMALLDFTLWEAARLRLGLQPKSTDYGNEKEMEYRGLKIRRSAVS